MGGTYRQPGGIMATGTSKPSTPTTPAAKPDTDAATTSPATDADRPAAEALAQDNSPTTQNPVHKEGDRLAPLGTLSGNVRPADGTGFHCGICAREVGKEGQHYDADGDVVETPHANTVVVADNWAEARAAGDAEALADAADRKARRKADSEL